MRGFVGGLMLLVIAGSSGAADLKPPLDVTILPNIPYSTAGGEKLMMDIAMPKTGGPYPCVIGLHGGAWKMGSRKDLSVPTPDIDIGAPSKKSVIEVAAGQGFVVASVSYRLAPKHKFPAQIQDVKTAVRFLRANADRFHIDPTRIGAFGFSAGGHLAALLATTDKDPELDGTEYLEQSSRVSAVVDYFGPADLSLYADTPGVEKAFFIPFMGATYRDRPSLYKKASPVDHVSKDDPPFLIIHGTADLVVPIIHSERLHAKLTGAGVESRLLPVAGKGHGWGGEAGLETFRESVTFLTERLAKGK